MLSSCLPSVERVTSSQVHVAQDHCVMERKTHCVGHSERLSWSGSHVPPRFPFPVHSSGSYLQTTFISTHQKGKHRVRKKGETKLRYSVLDAAILNRNAKHPTPSLACLCGMAFCFHRPREPQRKKQLTGLSWGFWYTTDLPLSQH